MKDQTPPKHLRPATKLWWRSVVADWDLEPHHIRLLTLAATAWDRAEEAREILAREGVVVRDRWGQVKKHPACEIETAARSSFVAILRELDLDTADTPDAPRGPALKRNR